MRPYSPPIGARTAISNCGETPITSRSSFRSLFQTRLLACLEVKRPALLSEIDKPPPPLRLCPFPSPN